MGVQKTQGLLTSFLVSRTLPFQFSPENQQNNFSLTVLTHGSLSWKKRLFSGAEGFEPTNVRIKI